MATLPACWEDWGVVAGLTALAGGEPWNRPWPSWPRFPGGDQTLPAWPHSPADCARINHALVGEPDRGQLDRLDRGRLHCARRRGPDCGATIPEIPLDHLRRHGFSCASSCWLTHSTHTSETGSSSGRRESSTMACQVSSLNPFEQTVLNRFQWWFLPAVYRSVWEEYKILHRFFFFDNLHRFGFSWARESIKRVWFRYGGVLKPFSGLFGVGDAGVRWMWTSGSPRW